MRRRSTGVVGTALLVLGAVTGCSHQPAPVHTLRVEVITDQSAKSTGGAGWVDVLASRSGVSVERDVVAGSGWLTAAPGSVGDRIAALPAPPDVLVIALGANDVDLDAPAGLEAATVSAALGAATARCGHVVVVAPIVPEGTPAGSASQWSTGLRTTTSRSGGTYVALDFPSGGAMADPTGSLNQAGAEYVAAQVSAAVGS